MQHIVEYVLLSMAVMVLAQEFDDININGMQCRREGATFYFRSKDNNVQTCLTCIEFHLTSYNVQQLSCTSSFSNEIMLDRDFYNNYFMRYSYHPAYQSLKIVGTGYSEIKLKNDFTYEKSNLEYLNISKTNLLNLNPTFFYPFESLIMLALSNNKLNAIGDEDFSSLIKLQQLDLSKNNISHLNDPFVMLNDLFEIDLSFNKLTYLSNGIFRNQRHLQLVMLNNNELKHIFLSFENNWQNPVKILNLDYNTLESITVSKNIQNLLISHNKLTDLSLNFSSNLLSLNASFNNISSLSEYSLLNAINLENIDLSFNFLNNFPTNSFKNLNKLSTLNISHNLLGKNELGSTNNWISFFLHLKQLKSVSLDNNLWMCDNLKDILFILNFQNVKIAPGAEHLKSHYLGISCINLNHTNNALNESSIDIGSNVINKILKEVWSRLENTTKLDFKVSDGINTNFENYSSDVNMRFAKVIQEIAYLRTEIEKVKILNSNESISNKKVLSLDDISKSQNLSTRMDFDDKNIQLNYSALNDLESRLYQKIKILEAQITFHNENNSSAGVNEKFSLFNGTLLNNIENEIKKTEQILLTISSETIYGEIIQNLLLWSILCVILYVLYCRLKRNKVVSVNEDFGQVNLVERCSV